MLKLSQRWVQQSMTSATTKSSTIHPPNSTFPSGYKIGVTRYADVILENGFPQRFRELIQNLEEFSIDVSEVEAGGGSRATHTKRFDEGLARFGWGKRNIVIEKLIDGQRIQEVRGHEIDMFGEGSGNNFQLARTVRQVCDCVPSSATRSY